MGKKHKCPEFENHERWLVSYADMVTLLFAVFVVLYSLNMAGEKSEDKAAGSMQESFNAPLEDIPIDRRLGPSEQGFGIFEHMAGNRILPPLTPKYPSTEDSERVINDEMAKIKVELKNRLYGPEKFRPKNDPGFERLIDISRTPTGFKMQMMARHFYDPGAVTIKRSARKDIDEVITVLKGLGRPITVEGHTDSMPPKGELSNWDLSALRATHVLRYMIRRHQFPSTLLSAAGYADLRPVAPNSNASGRALNRRIEIQIHYDKQETTNL